MLRRLKRWWLQGAYRQALQLLQRKCVLERYGYDMTVACERLLFHRSFERLMDMVDHYHILLNIEDFPIPQDCRKLESTISRMVEEMKEIEHEMDC